MAEFRPVNLAEIYGQIDTARANQANMENNRMLQERQRRQFALEDEQQQNKVRLRDAYKSSYDTVDGVPTLNKGRLLSSVLDIDPTQAPVLEEQFNTQEAKKLEMMVNKAKVGRDVMVNVTPETWGQTRQQLINQGFEFAKSLPEQYDINAHKASVMDADTFLKQNTPKAVEIAQLNDGTIYDKNNPTGIELGKKYAEPKAPTSRTIRQGNEQVTQEFNPANGQWTETGRGSAFAPSTDNSAPVQIMGADGKPIFVNRKDAIGKQPYSAKQEAADAAKVAQTSQASISTQQVLDQAQLLFQHPGRSLATGASSFMSMIPGTDAKGFQANLDTFKAQTFVPMVSALKGMGALSDAEGKKLSESVGALNPDMPEKEFEESLKTVTKTLFDKAKASGLNVSIPEFANTPTTKAQGAIAKVTNNADYAKLPKGAKYTDPKGNVRTKK